MFQLIPHRDLPPDFDQRYRSAYLDPVWFDIVDPVDWYEPLFGKRTACPAEP